MIRRLVPAALALALLTPCAVAQPAATGKVPVPRTVKEPRDVVAAIYDEVRAQMRKKSPESPFFLRPLRQKYFSKAFDLLITAAETKAAHDKSSVLDFDPITAAQDPDVGQVALKTNLLETAKATVSASFKNRGQDEVVTYDFVKEDGDWRINDIKGTTEKEAWSVRKILKTGGAEPSTLPGMKDAGKKPDAPLVVPPRRPSDAELQKSGR